MMKAIIASLLLCTAAAADSKPIAAELRRYATKDCTGKYDALNQDVLNKCSPKIIPASASISVVQLNETAYASYHFQGTLDCSGENKEFLAAFPVGSCMVMDDTYSQQRVWVYGTPDTDAVCAVAGVCGKAYKACCAVAKASGHECGCHLRNGTGLVDTPDCGKCGSAFASCCVGFQLQGNPCGCDVLSGTGSSIVV